MSAVLSNSYFSILITLHRNLLPSNPDYPRPKPSPSSNSLAHCVDAARSAIHVAARSTVLVPVSHHIAVFCQYLWSSAVILLLCEMRAKEQLILDAVGAQVESCHRSLEALEPVWPGCRKLRALLTDVESRAKEVRANVIPRPVKKRKSSVATDNGRRSSQTKPSASPVAPTQNLHPPPFERNPSSASYTAPMAAPMHIDANAFNFFDVGDMNFDGLEMLSAFTSDAWNAPLPSASPLDRNGTPVTGVPAASPTNRLLNNGSGPTPPSLGSAAIQSPVTTTGPGSTSSGGGGGGPSWFTQGLGPTAPSPAPAPSDLHEMWAQITGTSFDWQADPNVPFNI